MLKDDYECYGFGMFIVAFNEVILNFVSIMYNGLPVRNLIE